MNGRRESGILLHPTSLPGAYGIGDVGPEARRFVDFLHETGQHLWQVLPLGPTGFGDSPYQALSTFAGNPMLISPDDLMEDHLLQSEDMVRYPALSAQQVDYGAVIPAKMDVLNTVCGHFRDRADDQIMLAFEAFCEKHGAAWLDDYALFAALKVAHGGKPWYEWEPALVRRDEAALAEARSRHAAEIEDARVLQFLFFRQWNRLRAYCHERQVALVGDIPIYIAHDSADAWARQEVLRLDEKGRTTVVAGVPPDYFSATGQRWGNPIYRWDKMAEDGFAWWKQRLRATLETVDIVRIDHFRGFEAYWEIPAEEATAVKGEWVKGPDHALFEAFRDEFGSDLPIIAEDLGVITPEVEALRDDFELPGMRILQFAFGTDPKADEFKPEAFPANCIVYTGTHDNDTTVGWFHSEAGADSTRSAEDIAAEQKRVLDYTGTDGSEIHWDFIEMALKSPADTAIVPMQDLLGLGSEARMNVPGRGSGNWVWRFSWEAVTPELGKRLRSVAEQAGRI